MKIADTPITSYGNFEIDRESIGSTSTTDNRISLAYTGPLPATMGAAESATVEILLSLQLNVRAVLVLQQNSKEKRFLLDSTPEELREVLTTFFFKGHRKPNGGGNMTTRHDNGLTEFWNGQLQGLFIVWDQITRQPSAMSDAVILSILQGTSAERIQELLDRLHPHGEK